MGESALARPVTVAVVDDHQVVLDGIRSWIERDPLRRIEVIADGLWVDSVLAGPGAYADVLVLDLGIFGESVVDRIADLAADRRVVAFSADITDDTIRAVLDAGASAYLSKHEGSETSSRQWSRRHGTAHMSRRRWPRRCSVTQAHLARGCRPRNSGPCGCGSNCRRSTTSLARWGSRSRRLTSTSAGPGSSTRPWADRCRTRRPWWLAPSKTGSSVRRTFADASDDPRTGVMT